MSILHKWVIPLISLSIVFILTLPSPGNCDDWVYINKDVMCSYYYNRESININRNINIIDVWVKFIYTEEGKKLFSICDSNLSLYKFDYNKRQYQEIKSIWYKSSKIIQTDSSEIEWEYIKPGSIIDEIINKIFDDYNIKMVVSTDSPEKKVNNDDWVYVLNDDMFSFYYDNKNIHIDRDSKKIEVWVKEELSEKEREKSKLLDKLNYYLTLNLFDYDKMEFKQIKSFSCFMSGVKKSIESDIEWEDVKPGDVYDKIFTKILEDHNIQR